MTNSRDGRRSFLKMAFPVAKMALPVAAQLLLKRTNAQSRDTRDSTTMPRIIVFDVIETLLDVRALAPHFQRAFGDAAVLQQWFAQLLLYSEVATIAGPYFDFSAIGGAALDMVAAARKAVLSPSDRAQILKGMLSLPAHPDVPDGLKRLRAAGLRLVTLTNSSQRTVEEQLNNAGLSGYFDRAFSVDGVRRYKPARETYQMVANELKVTTGDLRLVAAHAWDLIGALQAGCAAAFIARPGNALYPLAGKPDIAGADLRVVVAEILKLEIRPAQRGSAR